MAATTFPNIPAHVESSGKKVEFKTLEAEFGDGYEQVSQEGLNNKRQEYSLTWANEDLTDANTIETFLDARGGSEPFYWTEPLASTATLWRCTSYTSRVTGYNSKTINATFKRWNGPTP